ncbi:ligase-associated DNA damage response DEXH box helicase [Marinimicrococcus flavescens]|uniref:Ligase-associated DNA damage response DEXH box helicase n=1 Tax=Marinimicrococcus flavescens TaxID=3031815 RepID=A0AAP3XRQ3_9PROT|nr:ligase-associated DNA damage response DEXH box helicase [Marinimicrococcus flavescens]
MLPVTLPAPFEAWFAQRGWRLRGHQARMLELAQEGRDALLVAPTGGGKTLAGFLPSLVALAGGERRGLHTLYVSPLKALTVDVGRNLEAPIAEMGLPVRWAARTGDTPQNRRARQRKDPPGILLTTPESLALLLSYEDAATFFGGLEAVILDELHALAESKRGVLLSLALARLRTLAPKARFTGLSATVAEPERLRRWLSPAPERVAVVEGDPGAKPEVGILVPRGYMPWAGHIALYAARDVYGLIRAHRTTLVFVNTRAQAELVFGALWRENREDLAIALHHGSLAPEQRRKVEAAMARGGLRAVVCTSSLDLGIDWGDVDLVVQVGAPKGVSRLLQRIGRANHRLDEPSRAMLIPANRFEVLECMAALEAMEAGTLDAVPPPPGGLDVLAQHITGIACSGPFDADTLYEEVRRAAPYADLAREAFDATLNFVATGGYALQVYERYRRLVQDEDGRWRLTDKKLARQYRMNVGTIVEAPVMRVRLGLRGRRLGEVEEYFVSMLQPGDTFLFAGRLLRFQGIRDNEVIVKTAHGTLDPKVPAYAGGRLPLSSHLAQRVRGMLGSHGNWQRLPAQVREWLEHQEKRSSLPSPDELLVETFARGGRHFLVAYCFAGRNAHQTLGMLLTRRMERAGLRPQGFVASDYNIAVWGLEPAGDVASLFALDMLGDDLEEWMAESSMLKRTFRNGAVVAGLIERRHPGQRKTGRQVTFSADLVYDVLRKYEPDHVLLQAARAEAAYGLTDIRRLADLLAEVQGRIRHVRLSRISPFAVSIIAGIGKEQVGGGDVDRDLEEAVAELVAEAMDETVAA